MEYGTIEREVEIDASPATVFEVITSPEHLKEWWPDDAQVAGITVVEVVPPTRFSFRWIHPEGDTAREGNSLLVVFEVIPSGDGTRLRMTESGFREMGWEVAVLEEQYREHVAGWDHFLPRLVSYAATVPVAT